MITNGALLKAFFPALLGAGALLLLSGSVLAHCDTMDGPVIAAAKAALAKGDVTPVLKWVKPDAEKELRAAFEKALTVRSKGPEARELADQYLFETLVRVHRAGEGAPYTGLKPAGTEIEPVVAAADQALEAGKADALVKMITETAAKGLRERFASALEKRKRADESVEAGREYVAAYVEFVHYAERLHADAAGAAGHHGEEAGEAAHEGHHH
jgi:hypothetical protein